MFVDNFAVTTKVLFFSCMVPHIEYCCYVTIDNDISIHDRMSDVSVLCSYLPSTILHVQLYIQCMYNVCAYISLKLTNIKSTLQNPCHPNMFDIRFHAQSVIYQQRTRQIMKNDALNVSIFLGNITYTLGYTYIHSVFGVA